MALKTYGSPASISYITMDDFVMEAARLVSTVSSTSKEGKAARGALQTFFSDFIETKWGLGPAAKKARGSTAPDVISTEEEVLEVIGVASSHLENLKAERTVELKSKIGTSATTLTQYTVQDEDIGEFQTFFGGQGGQRKGSIRTATGKQLKGGGQRIIAPGRPLERVEKYNIPGQKRNVFDADGNIIIGNLSSASIKEWILFGTGKTAKTLRTQITLKAKESFEINLKFDELKKGTKKKYTLYPKLDPKKHFNYNISTGGVIQVEYSSAAAKLATEANFFKLAGTTSKAMLRDFLDYLNARLRAADKTQTIVTLINAVKEFQPGLTPFVLSASMKFSKPFYKGRVSLVSKKSQRKKQPSRGIFISNVQLSAILQKRLAKVMPRFSEPQRPTPRYVTGGLAQSFQIMANYRTGLLGYFNTPPASGYVDELNQNGWMLDKTLVEPTIRVITQQLFGRQFKVLRTQ